MSERKEGLSFRQPALTDLKDDLFSIVHLCQNGSLASSSAPSPRTGSAFSRSQSIVSDDFSCVPPEEPEWLSKMAAARVMSRGLSGRSRPASRRDSGLSAGQGRAPGGGGGGCSGGIAPAPLRSSLSATTSIALEDAAAGGGGAPSPWGVDTARQSLFERFGSFEGLSAALEDFHHRLCSDDRVGAKIKQVPEEDMWLTMTQLMALSLQQQDHEDPIHASRPQDRHSWMRRCQALLRVEGEGTAAGGAAAAEDGMDEQHTAEVCDAVQANLLATLDRLGVLGAGSGCRSSGGGGGGEVEELPEADAEAVLACDESSPPNVRTLPSATLAAAVAV